MGSLHRTAGWRAAAQKYQSPVGQQAAAPAPRRKGDQQATTSKTLNPSGCF